MIYNTMNYIHLFLFYLNVLNEWKEEKENKI